MKIRILAAFAVLGLTAALTAATLGNRSVTPADARATEANITRVTVGLLENSQFSRHPFGDELAGKFLDRYLDALDGSHVLFLQSDLEDFAPYRATLAQATRRTGDTSAARAVFDRYLERLAQRATYVTNALQTEKFDFTGHDVYSLDRENAPRPRDLAAARELWRRQLRAEYLEEKLGDKKPAEIAKILARRETQLLRNMKELSQDDVLDIYLNALAHVYDPHSDYFGREQMDSFTIAMNLSLCGIGATLQSEDGTCKIVDLVPGGPAARSGLLKPGDRIVAVAQAGKGPVDIVNMPLSHAVELIRGPKGSIVHLTIISSGASDNSIQKSITLVRDEVKLEDEQAKARIVDLPTGGGRTTRLGVIDLPSFYGDMAGRDGEKPRSAAADVAKLVVKLKEEKVRGIVLDLRRNGGGSLREAINLTGLFIPAGPVVQTRGPDGNIDIGSSSDSTALYKGPLVVLTSRFSASASEIFAGALQDYGRAVIVGDSKTFGKGTVQTVLPLAPIMDENEMSHAYDPGALKVTIRKFYRPSGASTQLKGVASDIVLPSMTDLSDVNESALQNPLPWDIVPAADFEHLNEVQPCIATLRAESAGRVASEKDFACLRDELAQLKRNQATKTVSLNEANRRQEMAQAQAMQSEYDKAVMALGSTRPVTYEITLKNALLPGLPAPSLFTNSVAKAQAGKSAVKENKLDLDGADRSTSQDIILTETEHILADYAVLLGHKTETVVSLR